MVTLCDEVTYVLELEDNNWYVGKTKYLNHRLSQHFTGNGAKWTKLHKPLSVVEVLAGNIEEGTTLRYMRTYGIESTRGYSWCQTTLSKYGLNNIIDRLL